MGWNTGYTIFESTVIGAYDLGKLDKDLLHVLMDPYAGTDIDSGGSADLKSHDGKDVMQIVLETAGCKLPHRPTKEADDDAWDEYQDEMYGLFHKTTREVFGWD